MINNNSSNDQSIENSLGNHNSLNDQSDALTLTKSKKYPQKISKRDLHSRISIMRDRLRAAMSPSRSNTISRIQSNRDWNKQENENTQTRLLKIIQVLEKNRKEQSSTREMQITIGQKDKNSKTITVMVPHCSDLAEEHDVNHTGQFDDGDWTFFDNQWMESFDSFNFPSDNTISSSSTTNMNLSAFEPFEPFEPFRSFEQQVNFDDGNFIVHKSPKLIKKNNPSLLRSPPSISCARQRTPSKSANLPSLDTPIMKVLHPHSVTNPEMRESFPMKIDKGYELDEKNFKKVKLFRKKVALVKSDSLKQKSQEIQMKF